MFRQSRDTHSLDQRQPDNHGHHPGAASSRHVATTNGCALGILYVLASSAVWGLTVIRCNSVEVNGAMRELCSMAAVLMEVNGSTYFSDDYMTGA